mmetsp:Transcript_97455/g.278677  ORF Transcript_97455/g.278677 Transcript_97455/m.278677 type:complete len:98 (-) Transcript_97455:557-850(-)
MDGEWVAGGEYFKGAESGVNHLSDFSPKVDSVTRELIASKLAEIEAGSTDVFCGHVPLANGGAVVDNFCRSTIVAKCPKSAALVTTPVFSQWTGTTP